MERAALITGGSSGIGLAIARTLGRGRLRDHALRPPARQARGRRRRSCATRASTCTSVPANMAEEDDIKHVVAEHRSASGASTCWSTTPASASAAAIADAETKKLDMQLDVNLRAVYLIARECDPDAQGGRRRARQGADREHGLDRRQVRPGLAGGLLGHQVRRGRPDARRCTRSSASDGIQATALCPGFVATPMTDWVEGQVPKEEMIQPRGHRRGGPLPAAHVTGVRRAGDPVHAGPATL